MSITIRAYTESDWDTVARIHDSARLDELRLSVGVEAFLDLAATYDSEGLFDGDVWVAELDGEVAGFIAFSDDEITWTYVHPVAYRRGVGRMLLRHILARGHRRGRADGVGRELPRAEPVRERGIRPAGNQDRIPGRQRIVHRDRTHPDVHPTLD